MYYLWEYWNNFYRGTIHWSEQCIYISEKNMKNFNKNTDDSLSILDTGSGDTKSILGILVWNLSTYFIFVCPLMGKKSACKYKRRHKHSSKNFSNNKVLSQLFQFWNSGFKGRTRIGREAWAFLRSPLALSTSVAANFSAYAGGFVG